ncbi:MAG: ABC transporter substrate-binding protein [Candidatus Humimicrobiaceae bacterium]
MKKFFVCLLSIAFVVSMLFVGVGCKTETTTETTAVGTAAAVVDTTEAATESTIKETTPTEGVVTLDVDNDGTLEWDPATVWQKEQFEKMYPNIKIQFHETPYNEHLETLLRMASGAQEPYDVWQVTDEWMPSVMKTGILMPIDQIWTEDKLAMYADWEKKAILDKDGNKVLVPVFGVIPIFMYNTELLKSAGFQEPPKTWDEIVSYAQKLTKSDQSVYGFVDTEDSINKFWHWVLQAGGKPFNDDWTAAFNSEAGVKALQYLVDLRNKSKVVPIGAVTWMTEDEQVLFISGKSAMSLSWAYGIDRAANSEESQIKNKFSVASFPEGPGKTNATIYEDNHYCIPKTIPKEKLDAALKWLDYVSSYDAQVGMLVHEPGNYVPIPKAYEEPEVKEKVPFADLLKLQVENSQNIVPPNMGEVASALLSEIQQALLGQKTAEQALNDAATKINEIVKQ